MTKVKFIRVTNLPSEGQVGGLYFVDCEPDPRIYLCMEPGIFVPYTPQVYLEHTSSAQEFSENIEIVEDTLIMSNDVVTCKNNILKISPLFATVEGDKLVLNHE